MAFPTNPTTGQTHTIDNKTWVFNGKGWQVSRENEQYFMTPAERAKLQNIEAGAQVNTVNSVNGKTGSVTFTKSDIGLSEVDNTSDINKPISNLQQQALDNKVDKNGTDRLLTQTEAELIEGMSPIEFEVTDVINGIIIPESPTKLYRISTATDLTVTINTALLDLTKYIKLFVKVNINDWCTITWPSNFYFANLNYPVQVGEYMYEVSSSDGGETWRASQRYKNIASVGLDQEGNEIIGAKTLFVDGEKADNSGDGLTWLTAKKDVQAAIDIATIGDAVFVKGKLGGLKYLPTTERTPGTARSKSFIMKSGVHLYGGFKGIETTLYEREMVSYLQIMRLPTGTYNMYIDLPKYRSILSGEIAGDSVKGTVTAGSEFTNASIANNSYVVVWGDVAGNTAFNGFDVIGAFNDQSYNGGGIYGSQGLKVSNCEVYNNRRFHTIHNALYGGVGIHNATVNNTIIRNNDSNSMNPSSGTGCLTCTISNSIIHSHVVSGGSYGGGQGTVQGGSILNSAVFNNTIIQGGLNTSGIMSAIAINSVSYNNISSSGYGAGFHGCTATNCSAYNNSKAASSTVGAGFVSSTCINCTSYNNTAPLGAGFHSCSTCVNCAAYNNTATGNGGGFLGCTCINCVSIRNKAATGGGSYNSILRNTVVYGNKNSVGNKSNVYNDNASEETYSAFEDEIRPGTGNISLSVNNTGDANSPYFQSLSTESGVVDELYVSNPNINSDSALKNSGLDSLNTHSYGGLYDMMSNPRKVNTIDIGAYEIQ